MKKNKIAYFTLLLLFVLIAVLKITHGIEIDEEEALASAYRLSLDVRSSVFSKNWDNLQLSSIFLLPIVYICKLFSFDNYVITVRAFTLLIQIIFSFYIRRFMIKEIGIKENLSNYSSLLFILSTPKKLYTADHSLLVVWFFTLFACELYKYLNNKDNKSLYISGSMYALSVLAHPASVVVLPIVLIILIVNKKYKEILRFLIPCVVLFVCFVIIFVLKNNLLFKDISFFLSSMLNEGSHGVKGSSLIGKFAFMLMICYVIVSLFSKPILNRLKPDFLITTSLSIVGFGYVTTSLLWNIFIQKPICFFEEGLLIISIYLMICLFYKKDSFKYVGILFLSLFIGILVLSNMPIQPNAQYLYPFVIVGFVKLLNNKDYLGKATIVIYALLLVFINLKYDDENNSFNLITINNYPNQRVLNGIKTTHDLSMYYSSLGDFELEDKDVVLISNRPRYLTYPILGSNVYAPTLVSTPTFDNQWVEHFKYFKKDCYYVLIDNYSGMNIDIFINDTFLGKYVSKEFTIDLIKENNYQSLFEVKLK